MLERELSKTFTEIFHEYAIWTPNNRTAGWPDRGIQLSNSRIIWFELKIVRERNQGQTILISNLQKEQAAWLAKWQKSFGFCYLFLGLLDHNDDLRYGILRVSFWQLWLKVPSQQILIEQLVIRTDNKWEILAWFKDLFQPKSG